MNSILTKVGLQFDTKVRFNQVITARTSKHFKISLISFCNFNLKYSEYKIFILNNDTDLNQVKIQYSFESSDYNSNRLLNVKFAFS